MTLGPSRADACQLLLSRTVACVIDCRTVVPQRNPALWSRCFGGKEQPIKPRASFPKRHPPHGHPSSRFLICFIFPPPPPPPPLSPPHFSFPPLLSLYFMQRLHHCAAIKRRFLPLLLRTFPSLPFLQQKVPCIRHCAAHPTALGNHKPEPQGPVLGRAATRLAFASPSVTPRKHLTKLPRR